jgi:hypothetical protein
MDGYEELERLGQPYWQCSTCPYGSMNRSLTEAHVRDHAPRVTLEERLAAEQAPAEAPVVASPPTPRRRR